MIAKIKGDLNRASNQISNELFFVSAVCFDLSRLNLVINISITGIIKNVEGGKYRNIPLNFKPTNADIGIGRPSYTSGRNLYF